MPFSTCALSVCVVDLYFCMMLTLQGLLNSKPAGALT